ncbi:Gfo/Idh/MocA family oxidoreductase [Akkermansiaceae bacterium]|jgi:predicted dehydrogenase|nr:Gfo/Idh/MocA family oxidoreductase [Verrucomicrobiota bacterium]MDA7499153.1 Gfo/Idh/MocA family oxidoreductase [Akkermansiaceae bacterium]MDA7516052.1 Gfo/Idh/MocA family oxidoreductase [bacterium]MBT6168400.1 Gfo/Idh/MocA family oxidoreductase [Verrucomicrobiota bacterium]MBT6399472.1 Gfo/Idh/MocA family oxidoreductase [Verrucomicrobiota bacterium]
MNRKLRMGMVGGGRGAFIGQVHRMAANLDGKIELVAGAFSSDPEKSKLSGQDFFIDPDRAYGSYEEMAKAEAAREDGIDFVSIVVQNHLHFAVAKCFLDAGINVICDKPLTVDLQQAKELKRIVEDSGLIFALTHNYTGYPMVKEARRMVKDGELGRLLKIVTEYPQGYAVGDVEGEGSGAIANWRADPKIAGKSNCMGDIGTHAHNLTKYITGLEIDELAAELTAFIPGRELDDDGNCLVRFTEGVKGIIYASQISNGDENNLNIRVYGTKASLEWHQEDPNELIVKFANAPRKTYRRGNDYLGAAAQNNSRTPFAHPEGFIEAFANVYLAAAKAISDQIDGTPPPDEGYDFPTVDDGVAGVAFIAACVESSQKNASWTKLDF